MQPFSKTSDAMSNAAANRYGSETSRRISPHLALNVEDAREPPPSHVSKNRPRERSDAYLNCNVAPDWRKTPDPTGPSIGVPE